MASERSGKQLTTSLAGSATSIEAFAAARAKLMVGGYPRAYAHDPDTYLVTITAVLACFDEEIIRRVTDPRSGISTDERFVQTLPTSGQLKAYCNAVWQQRQARLPVEKPKQLEYRVSDETRAKVSGMLKGLADELRSRWPKPQSRHTPLREAAE